MDKPPRIAIDTQCFSYLIDAITGLDEPMDPLAEERKALIRCWFYVAETFYLPETVISECAAIRHADRKELHESFIRVLFMDSPIQDATAVDARVIQLMAVHPREKDCRVLAETEELKPAVLLTYDKNFLSRLSPIAEGATLFTPSVYWASLNIPRGASLKIRPDITNPLNQRTWWLW